MLHDHMCNKSNWRAVQEQGEFAGISQRAIRLLVTFVVVVIVMVSRRRNVDELFRVAFGFQPQVGDGTERIPMVNGGSGRR